MDKLKRRRNIFTDNLQKEFPYLTKGGDKIDESIVRCTICRSEFSLAIGGRSAITKHLETRKHKAQLDAVSSNSKITIFTKSAKFGVDEKKSAIAEGTFAYHTIVHNQSFRSMDCTSKMIKKFYNPKFTCARTKCEAIIVSVFKSYCDETLLNELEKTSFVSILSDASNHNDIKLYPVLVRYFNLASGVKIKILNLESIVGETAELLSKHLFDILTKNNLGSKVLALSADNTNTNFGGCKRRGTNNVHTKLKSMLQRNIFGIGCNAHILSNAINTASSAMCIDVENILPTIYLYFSRFTVRVAKLQTFCEEADVEYKKLLGYSKVRWLALTPAIERVIKLYEPLRS